MNIENLTTQELLIIALFCGNDNRKKDITFNRAIIKELGLKLLNEIIEKKYTEKSKENE